MRRLASLCLFAPVIGLAAGPAFAAGMGKARPVVPPASAPPADLRGSLGLPGPIQPARPMQALALPPPGLAMAGLNTGGFSTPPPIVRLRSVGDPAPICRATCAEARTVCAGSDDAACDSRWVQCVADCSVIVAR